MHGGRSENGFVFSSISTLFEIGCGEKMGSFRKFPPGAGKSVFACVELRATRGGEPGGGFVPFRESVLFSPDWTGKMGSFRKNGLEALWGGLGRTARLS
jgi:hypothetical protein